MHPRTLLAALPALPALPLLVVACNSITGIGDLSVQNSDGATAGSGGPGGSSNAGGAGGTVDPGPMTVAADGVSITQIAVYQGPKRTIMGGTDSIPVPLVAGRDALIRVFVQTDAGYNGMPVTASLTLSDASASQQLTVTPAAASQESSLGSTINFEIPGATMQPGLGFRVDLTQPAGTSQGGNANAGYPAGGQSTLDVISDGPSLKVRVVPVAYGADGSNRLPDTSAAQIQAYHDEFYATYPIADIQIDVRSQPFSWTQQVDAGGNGWGELLDAIAQLRQKDGAPAYVYYFGAFEPAQSINQYCGGGCVAGLGNITQPGDVSIRAAIGLGYPGDIAATTIIHEIGHTQGRAHAPCGGPSGIDPAFPYSDGSIGSWGYNLVTKALENPGVATDMMGYCDNYFISDYTYKAIFQRIKTVNKAHKPVDWNMLDRTWERARIDMHGKLAWLAPLSHHEPPVGEPTSVTLSTAAGSAPVTAQYFPYDHIPGGILTWPAGPQPATSIAATVDGKLVTASR